MNVAAKQLSASALGTSIRAAGWSARRTAIALYSLCGGLTIVAYHALGGQQSGAAFVAVSMLGLAALVVGPIVHRPTSTLPWRWLAAGQAAFVVGNVARLFFRLGGPAELAWLSDLGYVGYLMMAIGLMAFIRVRRPRYRLARLVDGLAIGGSVALVISMDAIAHALPADTNLARLLGVVVTPVFDALLVGGTAYLVIAGGGLRGRAQQLLLLGAGLTAGADVIYSIQAAAGGVSHGLLDTMWMTSYLLIGGAALTPSMRQLTEIQTEEPERAAGRSMLALAAGIVALTLINLATHLSSTPGLAGAEIAEGLLIALLLVRARDASRHEAAREKRLAILLSNAADALAVVDGEGTIKLANPAAARMFGVPAGSSIGHPVLEFLESVDADEREPIRDRLLRVLRTPGAEDHSIMRIRARDGTRRALDVTVANRLADPAVGGVVLNFRDVTDQLLAAAEVSRLGTAIEQAYDAVLVTDAEGKIEYVNPAFERVTGYSRDEVLGKNPRFLKSGDQSTAFYTAMWQTLTSGQPWRADFVNLRKDGTRYRMSGVITPLRDEAGRITGYVGVSRDLTRQRELEDSARTIARQRALIAETLRSTDPAGTPEQIAQMVCTQVVQLEGVTTAALVIFETSGRAIPYGIVDSDGQALPRRRLPRRRADEVRERATRGPWIEAWEDKPWHPYNELLNGLGVRALGVAPVRSHQEVVGYLLASSAAANAESALSDVLPALVEFADISATLLGARIAERTQVSVARQHVAQIIDRRQFSPVYQPLHDAVSGRVVGYEALTRFDDGVSPDIRFAEAYDVGLGEKLELVAIQAAIGGASGIAHELWLNINASPAVLMNGGALGRLLAATERDVVLEVTEHTEITDYQRFRRAVQDLGPRVRLAVDDAGAGFASLRHILELRPAFVKLDRQMIAGIDRDEARKAMVAGLKHFALNTSCWLIAEGVETQAELKSLRDLGVPYVQGYLLGRPMSAPGPKAPPASPGGGGSTALGSLSRRRR